MRPSSHGDERDPAAQVPPGAPGGLLTRPSAVRLLTLATTVAGAAVIASAITYNALQDSDGIEALERSSSGDTPLPNFPPAPTESPSPSSSPPEPTDPTPPGPSKPSAPASSPPPEAGAPPPASKSPSKPSKPKPTASKAPQKPADKTRSLQSVNYPDRYVRHRDGQGVLDRVDGHDAAQARRDATFTVVAGLADKQCSSFVARDGRYLRHVNFRVRLGSPDGSSLFKKDATFCERPGMVNGSISLESYNYPGRFLRHRDFQLRLDRYEHTTLFRADTSFRVVAALAR